MVNNLPEFSKTISTDHRQTSTTTLVPLDCALLRAILCEVGFFGRKPCQISESRTILHRYPEGCGFYSGPMAFAGLRVQSHNLSPGGATTNGPDATTPPAIRQNSGGGPAGGPGGGGGGVPAGGRGGGGGLFLPRVGGGLAGGQGGVQPGVGGGGVVRVRVKVTEPVEPVLVL